MTSRQSQHQRQDGRPSYAERMLQMLREAKESVEEVRSVQAFLEVLRSIYGLELPAGPKG